MIDEFDEGIPVKEEFDEISKPKHYNSHPSGIECIIIAEHHCYNIGCAIKYLWRQGLKDGEDSVKDLKKAVQYIQFQIQKIERDKNEQKLS